MDCPTCHLVDLNSCVSLLPFVGTIGRPAFLFFSTWFCIFFLVRRFFSGCPARLWVPCTSVCLRSIEWGPEQSDIALDLAIGNPGCGRGLEPDDPWSPFWPKPFYDSIIYFWFWAQYFMTFMPPCLCQNSCQVSNPPLTNYLLTFHFCYNHTQISYLWCCHIGSVDFI